MPFHFHISIQLKEPWVIVYPLCFPDERTRVPFREQFAGLETAFTTQIVLHSTNLTSLILNLALGRISPRGDKPHPTPTPRHSNRPQASRVLLGLVPALLALASARTVHDDAAIEPTAMSKLVRAVTGRNRAHTVPRTLPVYPVRLNSTKALSSRSADEPVLLALLQCSPCSPPRLLVKHPL